MNGRKRVETPCSEVFFIQQQITQSYKKQNLSKIGVLVQFATKPDVSWTIRAIHSAIMPVVPCGERQCDTFHPARGVGGWQWENEHGPEALEFSLTTSNARNHYEKVTACGCDVAS